MDGIGGKLCTEDPWEPEHLMAKSWCNTLQTTFEFSADLASLNITS